MMGLTDTDLAGFVAQGRRSQPTMPLLHCCDGATALEIIDKQKITPELCDVYHEPINYFFYGKSSYVPNESAPPSKIWSYYPVIFVYRPGANYNIKRVIPIDSGAFSGGIFSEYFHPSITKEDLLVGSDMDAAARVVRAFFGDNRKYLEERAKTLRPPHCPLIAMDLSNLIASVRSEKYDRRNSTVEVQVLGEIGCHGGLLEHIILPRDFQHLDQVMERIDNDWGVSKSFYRCSRIDPGKLAILAADKAADFVEGRYAGP